MKEIKQKLTSFVSGLDIPLFLSEEVSSAVHNLKQHKITRLWDNRTLLAELLETIDTHYTNHISTMLSKQEKKNSKKPTCNNVTAHFRAYHLSDTGRSTLHGSLGRVRFLCKRRQHTISRYMQSAKGFFVLSLEELVQARTNRLTTNHQLCLLEERRDGGKVREKVRGKKMK